jgi:hypothetical protein
MKMMRSLLISLGIIGLLLSSPGEERRDVDPRAERALKDACEYLAQAKEFSLTAEVWREHVEDSGQKVQYVRNMDLEVKRPNRLHADIYSSHTQRAFWYDGHSLTELDRKQNVFGTTKMPGTIDETLDKARDEFGIDLPLIDVAVSDPYKNAMEKVTKGIYFGTSTAMGFSCQHLAFRQENVDWEIWIQEGARPLIRKFVITYKTEPGQPEFTALIKEWDMVNRIADSTFVFQAPQEAVKVEMLKNGQSALSPTGRTNSQKVTSPKEKE